MKCIGVIGGGSAGTAIVHILTQNLKDVIIRWYIHSDRKREGIARGELSFHEKLNLSSNVAVCKWGEWKVPHDVLFIAVPSPFVKEVIESLPGSIHVIAHIVKGYIKNGNVINVSSFISKKFSHCGIVFLGGPAHAEEIMENKITPFFAGGTSPDAISTVKNLLKNHYIKVYEITDPELLPVLEYGCSVKNIYAIGAGLLREHSAGDNAISFYTTSVLHEIYQQITLNHRITTSPMFILLWKGISADVFTTIYSPFSRNVRFGRRLAHVLNPDAIIKELGMIPEGYFMARAIYGTELFSSLGTTSPILVQLVNFLNNIEGTNLEKVVHALLG